VGKSCIPGAIFFLDPIMPELTCQHCEQLATELALKMLTDCQRAHARVHLAGCARGRDTVSALTTIAHQIIELLPPVQPPAGFEQRVIAALAQHQSPQHQSPQPPDGVGANLPEINQI
jgi:hypothetical protein